MLDLGTTDAVRLPTDQRIVKSVDGRDPHLVSLYFQYGRYLLIAGSREDAVDFLRVGRWPVSSGIAEL